MRVASGFAIAVSVLALTLPAAARTDGNAIAAAASNEAFRITNVDLFSTEFRSLEAAPAGVPVGMRVWLRNLSKSTAHDVVVTFTPPAGVSMPVAVADYGTIPATGEITRDFGFEIAANSCNRPTLDLSGVIGSSLGEQPFTINVNTDCPGPHLFVSALRFLGGNGDEVADPGERLQLFIRLQNTGRDTATNVEGTLDVQGAGITVASGTARWPDIRSGAVAENKTPFVIELSPTAERRPVCGTPIISSSEATPSPAAPQPVGFDAVVHVNATGRSVDTLFSSGVPCLPATSVEATQVARVDTTPEPAPASRIPLFLIVVGVGVAVAVVVRARASALGREHVDDERRP